MLRTLLATCAVVWLYKPVLFLTTNEERSTSPTLLVSIQPSLQADQKKLSSAIQNKYDGTRKLDRSIR